MNVYGFTNWFFMYSLLGYLLERIVLSVGHRRPAVDRGSGHGPSCVTYGFGALDAYMLLRSVSGSPIELYTVSMAIAIIMELVVANIMVRLSGSFQRDYSRKPFNYKGMICLESSLGWGLLGLLFFYFLDIRVRAAVFSLPGHVGSVLAVGLTMFYLMDSIHCSHLCLGGMEEEDAPAVGRLKIY